MKLTKYITTACIAALFTGCDYLDFDETTGMTKEEMYSYFGNVTSLSTFVYSQLPQDFGAIGDALRDAATDNAVYTWNQSSVYNVYNGTWSPLKTVDDVWSNYYTAIREANGSIESFIVSLQSCQGMERRLNKSINALISVLQDYLTTTEMISASADRITRKIYVVLDEIEMQ